MSHFAPGLMPDLTMWQQWAGGQRRGLAAVRSVKAHLTPSEEPRATLWWPQGPVSTLVVVDKATPSCRAAVVEPLRHLDLTRTAVLAPHDIAVATLIGAENAFEAQPYDGAENLPQSITSVLSLGAYLHWSADVARWADARGVAFHLAQHGLLTPWSPPASPGAHVLAWCESDAEYWSRGRSDTTVDVVGSQMLWSAAQGEGPTVTSDRLVMLGQLHGTELSRRETLATYLQMCGDGAMTYRPHPNEQDVVSRALHAVMRRRGVEFDTFDVALGELARPVVSIFSTGTLEAAMRGRPAWVAHPNPNPWLRDFWGRYGLNEWGGDPTPAWPVGDDQPAAVLAAAIEGR